MSRRRDFRNFLDPSVVRKIANYLVEKIDSKEKDDSLYLDMRTILKSPSVISAYMYYRGLHELYGSKKAEKIANLLGRVAISYDGMGRTQAMMVLMSGNLPYQKDVEWGDEILPESMRT